LASKKSPGMDAGPETTKDSVTGISMMGSRKGEPTSRKGKKGGKTTPRSEVDGCTAAGMGKKTLAGAKYGQDLQTGGGGGGRDKKKKTIWIW